MTSNGKKSNYKYLLGLFTRNLIFARMLKRKRLKKLFL